MKNMERKDRIGKYLIDGLKDYLFSQLSEEYLARAGLLEILKGIPVPLTRGDAKALAETSDFSLAKIGQNMLFVIGCDPNFRYARAYVDAIRVVATEKTGGLLLQEARGYAENGNCERACIYLRATICLFEQGSETMDDGAQAMNDHEGAKQDYAAALFEYALACRAMYLAEEDNEDYIGRFKAEAMEYFELATLAAPEIAEPYYYLGFAYINIGLYKKAELAWDSFMGLSDSKTDDPEIYKMRKEIKKKLDELTQPVLIEEGCNLVATGRYEEGIERLEQFVDSDFSRWWPLHYYLGIAYEGTGKFTAAVKSFKTVLKLNASHIESMQELVSIYAAAGDEENKVKYMQKIDIIKSH